MYNAEQKTKFIYQYSEAISLREFALNVFNTFEPHEEAYGSDLCTMDIDTIRPVFEGIAGIRSSSMRMPLNLLQEYVTWCKENNIPGTTDAVFQITDVSVEKLKRQTLRNPRHLQKYLDFVCEPESEETTDNNIRTFFWLAYSGMPSDDILHVESGDVDFRHMIVRFKDREYPIYIEALPAMRNCVELTQFVYKHAHYKNDTVIDRVPGNILIRGIRGLPNTNSIRAIVSRCGKKARDGGLDMDLNYYGVWLSGVFYRMYEMEQGGAPVDFTSVVMDRRDGKPLNLSSGRNTQGAKIRYMEKEYRIDYERWKRTLL